MSPHLPCTGPSAPYLGKSLANHFPDGGVNHVADHPEQLVFLFRLDRSPLVIIFIIAASI